MANKIFQLFLKVQIFFIFLFLHTEELFARTLEPGATINLQNQSDSLRKSAGFQEGITLGGVAADVIKAFLGLLGIIFVVLIILAGYNWMTAGGDEEKVTKAKKMITRAIIGIIIIVGAYAITYFVFSRIRGVDTGP